MVPKTQTVTDWMRWKVLKKMVERLKCEQKAEKSASLRFSVKAKYFLIKQNPFTKYKFSKKTWKGKEKGRQRGKEK